MIRMDDGSRPYLSILLIVLLLAGAVYFGVLFLLGDLRNDIAELRAFLGKKDKSAPPPPAK